MELSQCEEVERVFKASDNSKSLHTDLAQDRLVRSYMNGFLRGNKWLSVDDAH